MAEYGAALRLSVALKLVQCDKGEAVLPTAKELAEESSINNRNCSSICILSHYVILIFHIIGMISFIYISSHLPFIGSKIILLTAQNLQAF